MDLLLQSVIWKCIEKSLPDPYLAIHSQPWRMILQVECLEMTSRGIIIPIIMAYSGGTILTATIHVSGFGTVKTWWVGLIFSSCFCGKNTSSDLAKVPQWTQPFYAIKKCLRLLILTSHQYQQQNSNCYNGRHTWMKKSQLFRVQETPMLRRSRDMNRIAVQMNTRKK